MKKALPFLLLLTSVALLSVSVISTPTSAMDCTNLDMLAKGTLYSKDGSAVQTNVWFSVYPALDDYDFVIGENNIGSMTGFIMVWGTTGEPSNITGEQEYIQLSSIDKIVIDRLYHQGTPQTGHTVTVDDLDVYVPDDLPGYTAPPSTSSTDDKGEWFSSLLLPIGLAATATVAVLLVVGAYMSRRKK